MSRYRLSDVNTSWGRSRATCAIRCCIVHTCSDLCVSVMFPNNSSVTRPPPSLLPGSGGSPSPALHRYYEAATTAVVSRPCPPPFPALDRAALWLTSLVRSPRSGSPAPARLGVVHRFHPFPVFGPKGPTVLTSSQRTPVCLCHALGLRPSLGA